MSYSGRKGRHTSRDVGWERSRNGCAIYFEFETVKHLLVLRLDKNPIRPGFVNVVVYEAAANRRVTASEIPRKARAAVEDPEGCIESGVPVARASDDALRHLENLNDEVHVQSRAAGEVSGGDAQGPCVRVVGVAGPASDLLRGARSNRRRRRVGESWGQRRPRRALDY